MRRTREKSKARSSNGFTLIEVIISMAITIIVMGAVFGLLTRGQRSFQREPQVADLQQSARTALDMVSKDVLQAGFGLPPEFPAFTPKDVNPSVGDQGTAPDIIEIIGASQNLDELYTEPLRIDGFDGTRGTIDYDARYGINNINDIHLQVDDMVVVYSDLPVNNNWVLTWVTSIAEGAACPSALPCAELTFSLTNSSDVDIPAAYSRRDGADPPYDGLITPVSIVLYRTEMDGTNLVLKRQVNFGDSMPVGFVDDFQVVYMVGTQPAVEQNDPPHPQLVDTVPIRADDIISGVKVTVAARSADEDLEGASTGDSGNYIRKTFSSNISPRNIISSIAERTGGLGAN